MKLMGIIGLIMMVTIVFICWGGLVNDFEENYVDTNISQAESVDTSFRVDYSERTDEMNETFFPLIEDIEDLGSSEGWFDAVVSGAVVLPKLIITLPGMILSTISSAISDMVTMFTTIGIPPELTLIAIVLLTLLSVIKIISIIRSDPNV